jgi:hypothetical protein
MLDVCFVADNSLINRSAKEHRVDLLHLLDLIKAIKNYFLLLFKKHFKLRDVAKILLMSEFGEAKAKQSSKCLTPLLTQSRIFDYAEKNNITFKQKSLHRNPFNYYFGCLFAVIVSNAVKIFIKGNFRMQERHNHKNLVYLCGKLVSEPIKCICLDGRAAASIELATTENLSNTLTGEEITNTEFHRVLLFGKVASDVMTLKFRDLLAIEGKLRQGRWSDVGSNISTASEVWAHRYTVLNKKSNIINFNRGE